MRRRDFLETTALGAGLLAFLGARPGRLAAALAASRWKVRLGAPDWSLGKEGNPASFATAREIEGLEGVEVSCGKPGEHLPLFDAASRKPFLEAAKASSLAIPSTCLEVLHRDGLKDHPDAPKWVEEAIVITHALGARVILLPFFGDRKIDKRSEQEAVADRLKPLAPIAEKAGVVLGLEDTISAEDNARILDRVGSPAVKVYYDVGNSYWYDTKKTPKFDVYREVAWLGKDRIRQIHLKDRKPVGTGEIDFARFLEAAARGGFEGWMLLETSRKSMPAEAAAVKEIIARKIDTREA